MDEMKKISQLLARMERAAEEIKKLSSVSIFKWDYELSTSKYSILDTGRGDDDGKEA